VSLLSVSLPFHVNQMVLVGALPWEYNESFISLIPVSYKAVLVGAPAWEYSESVVSLIPVSYKSDGSRRSSSLGI
jgi:hypothetical protein